MISLNANLQNNSAIAPLSADVEHRHIEIIDQRALPFEVRLVTLNSVEDVDHAITDMLVRGAPLIGICAAYGMAIGVLSDASDSAVKQTAMRLRKTRPTAVNLMWAVDRMASAILAVPIAHRVDVAWQEAQRIESENILQNEQIALHGAKLIAEMAKTLNRTVHILTHCNAGRLATPVWGTALAPVYMAARQGIDVHVFVDETRPRNQGLLTAWELKAANIPHTLIVDNAGGYLMQQHRIDMAIVGADRVTKTGDVCNKIGTYLKALAACDNHIPFYAAFPLSTVDWALTDGVKEIPIENRSASEVTQITGVAESGNIEAVTFYDENQSVENPAFDVTPARLMTGLITEKGVCTPAQLVEWSPSF